MNERILLFYLNNLICNLNKRNHTRVFVSTRIDSFYHDFLIVILLVHYYITLIYNSLLHIFIKIVI